MSIHLSGKELMDPSGHMVSVDRSGRFRPVAINPVDHTAYWVRTEAGRLGVGCRMSEMLQQI